MNVSIPDDIAIAAVAGHETLTLSDVQITSTVLPNDTIHPESDGGGVRSDRKQKRAARTGALPMPDPYWQYHLGPANKLSKENVVNYNEVRRKLYFSGGSLCCGKSLIL